MSRSIRGRYVERVYMCFFIAACSWVAFYLNTTPVESEAPREQEVLYAQVPTALDPEGKPPVASPAKGPGSALAYMQVPRFGKDWLWTVVEGVDLDDLALGPGHYTGTPLMGARGNFAVAGHRAGHGDPFIDFEELKIGDDITFRQNGAWWTYSVIRGPEIIEPTQKWVLNQPSHVRKLTLTTCWPKYGSEKRLFIRALLTDWSSRDQGEEE